MSYQGNVGKGRYEILIIWLLRVEGCDIQNKMLSVGGQEMNEVTIREPGFEEAKQLAAMLSEDSVLRNDLGMDESNRPTVDDVLQKLEAWCPPRRATTYAILTGNRAVGTISISHRDPNSRSAQIGYWVGSRYRRCGCATKAFAAVLAQAASEGIVSVSAAVAVINTPSYRLWARHGSTATTTEDGKIRYQLDLTPTSPCP